MMAKAKDAARRLTGGVEAVKLDDRSDSCCPVCEAGGESKPAYPYTGADWQDGYVEACGVEHAVELLKEARNV